MIVSIQELEKSFGTQKVLSIDEMTFEPGLTCIMGRNGCGKTTLLNILTGQMPYDNGSVTYDGSPYSKAMASRLTLVQQKPMLFGRSVEENIAYPLKVRGYNRHDIHDRVVEMMSLLDIMDLRHKRGTELSGGECQKTAIARGLVFEPDFLMLDEPTSNIDSHSKEVIEEAVRRHSQKGNTVLWVTHDSNQAANIAARLIEL